HHVLRTSSCPPGNFTIGTEQNNWISKRCIAHHIKARTMQTDTVGVGRVVPAKLRAVDQNRRAILNALRTSAPQITGLGCKVRATTAPVLVLTLQLGSQNL